jgi:hypothetical protein
METAIERLLTSRQRAEIEQRSVRSIERERDRGDGCPYVKLGRRIYYRPDDVEKFIAANVRGAERYSAALPADRGRDGVRTDLTAAPAELSQSPRPGSQAARRLQHNRPMKNNAAPR